MKVVSAIATRSACVMYWSDGTRTLDTEHKVEKKKEEAAPNAKAAVNLGCIGYFWDKVGNK